MKADDPQRSVLFTLTELETLHDLVAAKIEGVLVHSQEYFRLEDIAHKLANAKKAQD